MHRGDYWSLCLQLSASSQSRVLVMQGVTMIHISLVGIFARCGFAHVSLILPFDRRPEATSVTVSL